MDLDLKDWIRSHPFLKPISEFQQRVEDSSTGTVDLAPAPAFDPYLPEHEQGVPLLRSEQVTVELGGAAAVLDRIVSRLVLAPLPDAVSQRVREIREAFDREPGAPLAAVRWVATGGGEPPPHAGLVRYLGWIALGRVLPRALEAYAQWRGSAARWVQAYCPTCGAAPPLSALVTQGAGRARQLACGCCRTRWVWQRIACPHCGNDDQDRMDVLELEGGEGLRLDVCRECKGYVKTVTQEPTPAFLLADWTTLHLDALARERGLERRGASLYEL